MKMRKRMSKIKTCSINKKDIKILEKKIDET